MTFETRALEYHARTHIWSPEAIIRALDFMVDTELNTLILHQVDIVERLVHPAALFGGDPGARNVHERYRSAYLELHRTIPVERARPYKNIEYIAWVIRQAAARGIAVFLNNKELDFRDVVLEFHPELSKNGVLCPSEPFWFDLVRFKYRELLTDLPDLAGVITAPGSPESRLSVSGHRCRCDRCANLDRSAWYARLLEAIYAETSAAGRTLVVRDFVHGPSDHAEIGSVMSRLPNDVVRSIKNTPRDYYPTYPHNPLIGATNGPEWIEVDTMGQFFGWGIAPAVMIDDLRSRLTYARERGAVGLLARVDWEALESHSAFDTPNLVNLHAAAALAVDPEVTTAEIFRRYLARSGSFPECAQDDEQVSVAEALAETLSTSWSSVAGTLFADGYVFSDSSSYPVSIDEAFWQGEKKHRLRDWDPTKRLSLDPTAENVRTLIAEKERALEIWRSMVARLAEGNPGLRPETYEDLLRRLRLAETYLEGFVHALRCAAVGRHLVVQGADADADLRDALPRYLDDLADFCDRADEVIAAFDVHPVAMLVNTTRLRCLHADVAAATGLSIVNDGP